MSKFHPYSILTGDIRVEFVIYSVLRDKNLQILEITKKTLSFKGGVIPEIFSIWKVDVRLNDL